MPEATSRWRRHAAAVVGLLAIATAPFLITLLKGEAPFFLDLQDHWYPFRLHAHNARMEGEFAHWCRYLFCGTPFLAQPSSALFYPPHFVLDLFHPSNTLLPQIIGHRFVLGLLMYVALLQRGTSRVAAFLGAGALITAGVTTLSVQQLAHLRALAWVPTLLIGSHFLSHGHRLRGVVWLSAGIAITFLAGYPAYLLRAAWIVLFLLVGDPAFPRTAAEWRDRGTKLVFAGVAAALAAVICSAQLLPSMHMTEISQRALGLDPGFADEFAAAPADLLMTLVPRFDADGGVVRAGFAYVGVAVWCLALLAVARRARGSIALAAAAVFALVVCLGSATPVGATLQSLPGLRYFRNPSQYLIPFTLAMTVLGALGLDAWLRQRPSRRELAVCVGVPAVLVLLGALLPSFPADGATRLRLGIVAGALAAVAVTWAVARTPVLITALLVAIPLADAGSLGFRYATRKGRTRPIAEIRRPDAPFARVAAHHAAKGDDQPARIVTSDRYFNWDNRGIAVGLENVRGLLSLVPLKVADVSRTIVEGEPFPREPAKVPLYDYGPQSALDSPEVSRLALRYAVGFPDSPGAEWRRIGPEEWERVSLRVVGLPYDEVHGSGVEWKSATVNTVTMLVFSNRASSLHWRATHDDGWTAFIDDAPVDVAASGHAFMAVEVPAGQSTVHWRYESPGYRTGLALSAAGLLAWCGLAFVARRRQSSS